MHPNDTLIPFNLHDFILYEPLAKVAEISK